MKIVNNIWPGSILKCYINVVDPWGRCQHVQGVWIRPSWPHWLLQIGDPFRILFGWRNRACSKVQTILGLQNLKNNEITSCFYFILYVNLLHSRILENSPIAVVLCGLGSLIPILCSFFHGIRIEHAPSVLIFAKWGQNVKSLWLQRAGISLLDGVRSKVRAFLILAIA